MNQPTYIHPTDQAIAAWAQLTLWILADDAGDNPPDVVHVDPRQVTRCVDRLPVHCPLCRAAMPADSHECVNCGAYLDL